MLFNHTGSVHTYRMRFPIDVVFLDRDLTVLSVKPRVGRGKAVKATRREMDVGARRRRRRGKRDHGGSRAALRGLDSSHGDRAP